MTLRFRGRAACGRLFVRDPDKSASNRKIENKTGDECTPYPYRLPVEGRGPTGFIVTGISPAVLDPLRFEGASEPEVPGEA
jgi:hypothetical protein